MTGDLSVWSGRKLNLEPPDYKSGGLHGLGTSRMGTYTARIIHEGHN